MTARGQISPSRQTHRNREMLQKWKGGGGELTIAQVAAEYGLSNSRCHKILLAERGRPQ